MIGIMAVAVAQERFGPPYVVLAYVRPNGYSSIGRLLPIISVRGHRVHCLVIFRGIDFERHGSPRTVRIDSSDLIDFVEVDIKLIA